jgi:hypothetical protein
MNSLNLQWEWYDSLDKKWKSYSKELNESLNDAFDKNKKYVKNLIF